MKKTLAVVLAGLTVTGMYAQDIDMEQIVRIRDSFGNTSSDRAAQNAISNTYNLKSLALNREEQGRTDHFFHDLEIRTGAMWLLLMTAVLVATLASAPLFNDLPEMLRNCAFMIVSAASTTGFQTVSANQLTTTFSSGAFLVLAIVMAVGGGAGATSGGIKFHRVGIIWKSIVSTIKSALFPPTARVVVEYHHIGRRRLRPDVSREALTVFTLYVITYVIGALAGIAYGYEATTSLFESVAMASNGGITAGISGPGMPLGLEMVYLLQMWAGRLEFVTLMALIVEVVVSVTPDADDVRKLLNGGKS